MVTAPERIRPHDFSLTQNRCVVNDEPYRLPIFGSLARSQDLDITIDTSSMVEL